MSQTSSTSHSRPVSAGSSSSPSSSPGSGGAARRMRATSAGTLPHTPAALIDTIAASAPSTAQTSQPKRTTQPEDEDEALTGVRQTAEYRAAWDLELWKAIQAERFRVQLEKQKASALAALKKSIQEKEKHLRADLRARGEACAARETKLAQGEAALAQSHAKLKAMEADLRRMRQQLLDAQARVEEEVRAQVRRANDDIAHKAKLLQERVAAAEAQARRAEERQKLDQAEYLNLYQEFSKFRAGQLTSSGVPRLGGTANSGADGAMGQSNQSALTFYLEQVQQLRAQHAEDLRLTQERLTQRHEAQLHDAHQRCRELEERNRRLTAALARRREQLRRGPQAASGPPIAAQTVLPPTPSQAQAPNRSTGATPKAAASALPSGLSLSVAELVTERNRLIRERATLLSESAGALQPADTVVRRLDARIAELEASLAARLEESDASTDGDAATAAVPVVVR